MKIRKNQKLDLSFKRYDKHLREMIHWKDFNINIFDISYQWYLQSI